MKQRYAWMEAVFGKGDVCDDREKAKCKEEFGDLLDWVCKNCEKRGEK